MTLSRTYLVTINQQPHEDSNEVALLIAEELDSYFEVISVKPWSEHQQPSLFNASAISTPETTPPLGNAFI